MLTRSLIKIINRISKTGGCKNKTFTYYFPPFFYNMAWL